jgi:hypothetical protein
MIEWAVGPRLVEILAAFPPAADSTHHGTVEAIPNDLQGHSVAIYLNFPSPCGPALGAYFAGDAAFDGNWKQLTGTLHPYTSCSLSGDLNLQATSQ